MIHEKNKPDFYGYNNLEEALQCWDQQILDAGEREEKIITQFNGNKIKIVEIKFPKVIIGYSEDV